MHAGSEVKDLVEAWHGVRRKQHVNLDARVKEITLDGLCTSCIPSSAPTDKLAQLKVTEAERGVAKPFPFIDVAEFLPPCAEVVTPTVSWHSYALFRGACFLCIGSRATTTRFQRGGCR